jgi:hypothetical protein
MGWDGKRARQKKKKLYRFGRAADFPCRATHFLIAPNICHTTDESYFMQAGHYIVVSAASFFKDWLQPVSEVETQIKKSHSDHFRVA